MFPVVVLDAVIVIVWLVLLEFVIPAELAPKYRPDMLGWAIIVGLILLVILTSHSMLNNSKLSLRRKIAGTAVSFVVFLGLVILVFSTTILPELPSNYTEFTRMRAIHEAGHAIVAETLAPGTVTSVRLVEPWRKRWLVLLKESSEGYVHRSITQTNRHNTLSGVFDDICIGLAGLAAVETVLQEKYRGAEGDITQAVNLLEHALNSGLIGAGPAPVKALTEEEKAQIIRDVLAREYERAKQVVADRRTDVEAVAARLQETNRMSGDELRALVGSR